MIDILLSVAGAWVVLVGVIYMSQRRLMYFPSDAEPHPRDHGLPQMESVRIAVDEAIEILAWWHPPADNTTPVLVFFHGNAGHIGERDFKVRQIVQAGYGVLLVTYRYNARAGGKPSEEALMTDARRAIEFVKRRGISEQRMVLYGESLGSGIAVAMAAEHDIAGLILETPYSRVVDVAQSRYWFAPARWLVHDRYDSLARIGKVRAPILIFHGDADKTIPIRFAEKLYDAAPEPKEAHYFPGGTHIDLYDHGAGKLVMDFLDRCSNRLRAA